MVTPSEMMKEMEWEQLTCGCHHTVGITRDGNMYSWGYGFDGQLGHGKRNDVGVPKLVTTSLIGKRVVHVACGGRHTAISTNEGELYTWYVCETLHSLEILHYLQERLIQKFLHCVAEEGPMVSWDTAILIVCQHFRRLQD